MHAIVAFVAVWAIIFIQSALAQSEYRPPSYFGDRLAPLSKECADGSYPECVKEAWKHRAAGRFEDAARHYHKACDLGAEANCVNAGVMYRRNPSTSPSDLVLADLYSRACTGDKVTGCGHLGVMYWEGKGRPRDFTMAVAYAKRSCDAGFKHGCEYLSQMQERLRERDARLAQKPSAPATAAPTPQSASVTPASAPPGISQANTDKLEADLIRTCNRVLGATTKLYERGGEAAVLEFETGNANVLQECRRRNIQIRPAAMREEPDERLKKLDAMKKELQARQASLDAEICSKKNQIFANIYKLEGMEEYLKQEAASIAADPKCSQLGLHKRPPPVLELVRICRELNGNIIQGNEVGERIRTLEAKAKEAQLKVPPRPGGRVKVGPKDYEDCRRVGVTLTPDRR